MTIVAATNSPSDSAEGVKPAPGKKADAAPPPPKIGWIERATRLVAFPLSLVAAAATFHGMSRNGVKAFYKEQGKLDAINKATREKFMEADRHPDPSQLSRRLGAIIQDSEKGASALMRNEGFNTLRYFSANPSENKFNILMNTGGAFSITLGLFTSIADPRNRAAISGLLRRLRGQEEQKKPEAQARI